MSRLLCSVAGAVAAAGLAMGGPAIAQMASGPSASTQMHYNQKVEAANHAILAESATDAQIRESDNAGVAALYSADMAAYRRQVMRNHRTTMRDARRYARQQRAYATAMRDWRMQVRACKRGDRSACKAPSPTYASYY